MPDFLIISDIPLAFGLLMGLIAIIFYTSGLNHPFWKRFYAICPAIVLCCFIPATFNTLGFFSPGDETHLGVGTSIYGFSATYFLPASLFLLTISMDVKKIIALGWKVIAMFLTATLAIVISGPIALMIAKQLSPSLFAGTELWRAFSTVAGSWVGGAANQVAMKELWHVSDNLFGTMILVDTANASLWLLVIFLLARHTRKIDKWLHADTKGMEFVINAVESYEKEHAKVPTLRDVMLMLGLTFAISGISNYLGKLIAQFFVQYSWAANYSFNSGFFWMVILVTIFGVILSFTPIRKVDDVGASKIGTAFIYILIATIGMQINLRGAIEHWQLMLIGTLWMAIHIVIVFIIARLIRAPLFYLCVGSNANTGGASSAAIVASAFHPSLAPVGVMLGILGYVLGTVCGYISALIMRAVLS